MIKQKIFISFCFLTLLSNTKIYPQIENHPLLTQKDKSAAIQNLLDTYLKDHGTPGAAVAWIDQGEIQFFCSGKMNLEDNLVTEDTIFEIGSITKVFTTLILMDLINKGIMQLDDPIEKYLSEMKIPELQGKKITLRHLATHTSGLPRLPDNFDPKDLSNPYVDYTVERLYNYIQSSNLTHPPGDYFEYSNIGMGLLGYILSLKSEKSYERLIESLITKPLNMPNTSVIITDQMAANFASGHHLQQKVNHWDFTSVFAGAGALCSNIKDMANFLAANMGSIESTLSPLCQTCHEKQYQVTPDTALGLGWILSTTNDATLIWHNGGTGGFRSYLGFNPKTQRGIVILSNSTEDWPDEFAKVLLDPNYQKQS